MARGKHARRTAGRVLPAVLVGLLAVSVAAGGAALAAYRYDRSRADRILPGVTVNGVDVSGMTRGQAARAVAASAAPILTAELSITAAGQTWRVTPAELGMVAEVGDAVDRALEVAESLSFPARVYHRLADAPVGEAIELGYRYDEAAVEAFVDRVYEAVAIPARNAAFRLRDDGQILMRRSRPGQELKEQVARARILRALEQRQREVTLPVRDIEPEVTVADLGYTIIVDRSTNQLKLYRGLKLLKVYPVATAAPGYVTPPGMWEVVDKRQNPTWYNPAPAGWGADLPVVIPPGPGNPLGTHALYLDAPGIRIHGTYDAASIGTYASHGCIRMYLDDAAELYGIVPVGTRVIIV